ncbi:hypothetical protein L1887_12673 [Cichorium endivia]|nr:hypothetical protein L1887_12673 [Cichorium endivia]
MAEDKIVIEKFNGSDFSWWKMQVEALLCQKDLDVVLGDKPIEMEKVAEDVGNSKDKKAKAVITLSLTKSVAFNILSETMARSMMEALSNMYEKPSAANKVFLMRELFTTRMNEEGSVTVHINNLNSILSRLSYVGIKFDNETQASLLLASLPDSWSGTVTVVTSSLGPVKELNIAGAESVSEDDALILSMESFVDSWVMDSGASFHAMDNGETMVNLKEGDFGKVQLANDEMLQVTGMRDIDLVTSLGTTWNLKNVRVIPELKKKLISVGQLDKQGLEVRFGGGKWRVVNGISVIAQGMKPGSLYMVEVPAEGSMIVPIKHDKIWFAKSSAKRVYFANMNSGAKGMLAERVGKSKPFKGFCDSGSTGCVPGTVTKSHWVLKTNTEKFSPVGSLQSLESVSGPRCISRAGGVSKPVETGDESVAGLATTELELVGASIGPSST